MRKTNQENDRDRKANPDLEAQGPNRNRHDRTIYRSRHEDRRDSKSRQSKSPDRSKSRDRLKFTGTKHRTKRKINYFLKLINNFTPAIVASVEETKLWTSNKFEMTGLKYCVRPL